ncbi:hypothetical protein FDP41_001610 [Naegleria fowleri]|uniref:RWP-RK domain-containing protein n=1 Tax=Naegleria fowleri TaxID=5763 RepID=A0A6A5BQ84_NAEFO|nr:uncharacterized protein FDP41_001610 [Naegleria fowleri]KAF0979267.1 hypothetical protein FDP41_001610 [Naegleria fowleri]CAG4707762.1 unnamed protein product [Naegleria fowleri]
MTNDAEIANGSMDPRSDPYDSASTHATTSSVDGNGRSQKSNQHQHHHLHASEEHFSSPTISKSGKNTFQVEQKLNPSKERSLLNLKSNHAHASLSASSGNNNTHVQNLGLISCGSSSGSNYNTSLATTTTITSKKSARKVVAVFVDDTSLTHLAPTSRSSRNCAETPSTSGCGGVVVHRHDGREEQDSLLNNVPSSKKSLHHHLASKSAAAMNSNNHNNNKSSSASSNSPQNLVWDGTCVSTTITTTTTTTKNHLHAIQTTNPSQSVLSKSSTPSTTTTNHIKFHMLDDPMMRANDDHRSNFVRIDEEQIRKVFHLTQRQAASCLGVSLSTLKRRFYEMRDSLKMDKWPTTATTTTTTATTTAATPSVKNGCCQTVSMPQTSASPQTPPSSSSSSHQQQSFQHVTPTCAINTTTCNNQSSHMSQQQQQQTTQHWNDSYHANHSKSSYDSFPVVQTQRRQESTSFMIHNGLLVNPSMIMSPSTMLSQEMNKHEEISSLTTNNGNNNNHTNNHHESTYNVRFSQSSHSQPPYHSYSNTHATDTNFQVHSINTSSCQQNLQPSPPSTFENPKYSHLHSDQRFNIPPSGMFFDKRPLFLTSSSSTLRRTSPPSYPSVDPSLNHSHKCYEYSPPSIHPPQSVFSGEEEQHSLIVLPSISSTYSDIHNIEHSHANHSSSTQHKKEDLISSCSRATLEKPHKISKPQKMKSHSNLATDGYDHSRNGLKSNMSFILNHSVKDPTHLDSDEWNTLMNAFKHR